MNLKKILFSILIFSSTLLYSENPSSRFSFYGFVRNDFFYNSRQNSEAIDGIFNIFPLPEKLDDDGKDLNSISQAEIISIATRIGMDIRGVELLGAQSSAKIEADFAGAGSNYFLFRIRQAYMKLNWQSSELLVGQTWHPLFGGTMPTMISLNTGAPFNPFNRSPQIRYKQQLGNHFSILGAAIYQMQYTSPGPQGMSNEYQKNAIIPNLFLGVEGNFGGFTAGIGGDFKSIKPVTDVRLNSFSGTAYLQYVLPKFQIKARGIFGQNLSDHLMSSGYGLSNTENGKMEFTNFNTVTSWLNITCGNKWRVGIFGGFSQNLGSEKELLSTDGYNYTFYGRGYFMDEQLILDALYRIAPHISFNIANFSFGLEYDFTYASYGRIDKNGKKTNSFSNEIEGVIYDYNLSNTFLDVKNHRIVAAVVYHF